MKKVFILGIAALAALAIVTACIVSEPVDGAASRLNADGTVTLELGFRNQGRALTAGIAQSTVNYYEAAFLSGGSVVRTTWGFGRSGSIQLAPGTYTTLVFAGRESDKILLAFGVATAIGGTSGVAAENGTVVAASFQVTITALTRNIDFTMQALTGASFVSSVGTTPHSTYVDAFENPINVHPATRDSTITGTWTIASTNLATIAPMVFFTGTPAGAVMSVGFSAEGSLDIPVNVTASLTTPSAANPALPTTGAIALSIDVPDVSAGVALIALNMPVTLFDDTDTDSNISPVTWFIRGGLNNGMPNAGNVSNPGVLGGAIILGWGASTSNPTIILNPGWGP